MFIRDLMRELPSCKGKGIKGGVEHSAQNIHTVYVLE